MNWREFYNYWQNNYAEGKGFRRAIIQHLLDSGMEQEAANRIFHTAWATGHSVGYGEVLGYVSDLYWVVTGEYLQ